MKKMIAIILTLSLTTLSLVACGNGASESTAEPASSTASVGNESSTNSAGSEILMSSASAESSKAPVNSAAGEEKTFEEMQSLFVMDGEKTAERYVETNLTYTISGKTRDEIIAFMEKGIEAMGAKEDTLLDNDALYNYTGSYGDDEGLAIHVTEVSEGSFQIIVTYSK